MPTDPIMLTPGSFGWNVMTKRNPLIIEDVLKGSSFIPNAATQILTNPTEAIVEAVPLRGLDCEFWADQVQIYKGQKLLETPFIWAENYFYRMLIEAVGYLYEGESFLVDPFTALKQPTWNSPMRKMAATFKTISEPSEKLRNAIFTTIVGNGADLGFQAGANEGVHDRNTFSNLVINDVDELATFIADGDTNEITIVCDNTGEELLADLLLGLVILDNAWADKITYQLKPWPYFVSDATQGDFNQLVGGAPQWLQKSIQSYINAEKIITEASQLHVQPLEFRDVPTLVDEWNEKDLVLFKGDLNYRKLVGDRHWDPTTPFQDVTSFITTPLAALRLLKSDVLVGVDPETLDTRNRLSATWRVDGSAGVAQTNGM